MPRRTLLGLSAAAAAGTATGLGGGPAAAGRGGGPLVIAHRGACGYRPEHTLQGYALAARLGADYIEPDLVATADGVLVARHEPEISGTTDVARRPEFAGRRRTVMLDGVAVTGWFTHDFTLAELRTLRAVERLPALRQHNTLYDGRCTVPTFGEVLDLRARLSLELRRTIGVYPETKHPTYFRALGLPLEKPLVAALRAAGLNRSGAPVFVQSFEARSLRRLREQLGLRTAAVFLTSAEGGPFGDPRSYADYLSTAGLVELSGYADGIGPAKNQVIARRSDGTLGAPTGLVAAAHRAGLRVHPYTFRAENEFLPVDLRRGTDPRDFGRAVEEQVAFLRAGVDGLFTDQPDIGVLARAATGAGR